MCHICAQIPIDDTDSYKCKFCLRGIERSVQKIFFNSNIWQTMGNAHGYVVVGSDPYARTEDLVSMFISI